MSSWCSFASLSRPLPARGGTDAFAAIAEQLPVRVLRCFAPSGLIEPDDVRQMFAWENSGFLLDAAVRTAAHDRAGIGRLLPYWLGPSRSGLHNTSPDLAVDAMSAVGRHLPEASRVDTSCLTLVRGRSAC
jgi:hypothetical protein